MFKTSFLFELKLRFRSISTYVFLLMPFLIAFFAVSTSDFGRSAPARFSRMARSR